MVTITDTLKKPNNTGYTSPITFRLIDPPLDQTDKLVIGADISVTPNAGGTFSVSLLPGNYRVLIGDGRHLTISVPDNSNTYTLAQLSSCDLSYTTATPVGTADMGIRYCADLAALKALIPGSTIKLAFLASNTADVGSENIAHWYDWYFGDTTGADDIFVVADLGNTGRWFRRM